MDGFDGITAVMIQGCSDIDSSEDKTTNGTLLSAPDTANMDWATYGDEFNVAAKGGGIPPDAQEVESPDRPKKAHTGECVGETEGQQQLSNAKSPPKGK